MKNGKFICDKLKRVRQDIARANGIKYKPRECHHEGECKGSCPACESEMRFLEREIARRRSLGKAALVAGVSLGLTSFAATSCDQINQTIQSIVNHDEKNTDEQLMGEVPARNLVVDSIIADQFTMLSDKSFIENDYLENGHKAVFPGGPGALYNFIKKNFVCPEGVSEDVFTIIEVVIDAEGRVKEGAYVSYYYNGAEDFIAEALRVTKLLPKFEPARNEDGTVFESTYYLLFDAKRLKND